MKKKEVTANEVWSGPTYYLPNFETRLDDMSDEEFEELIKKGEEEKAINREVWGEDNITLV